MRKEDLEFFENLVGKDNMDKGFGRPYNLFAMEQGILIANALQTKEAIISFKDANFNTQKTLVPGLDDGHTGNTFGMSVAFAISYLPQILINKRDEKIDTIVNS